MNGVDVYGRYGNVVTSMSGLEVINNSVAVMLDPNPNNDLTISSNGLLGLGLLTTGMNSMQANLNMGNYKIINALTPTISTDVATKGYVDGAIGGDGALLLSGANQMAGSLNFGNNKGINALTPTTSTDVATKGYVDAVFSNLIASVINLISTTRTTLTLTKPLTNTTKVFMNVFYSNFSQYGSSSFLLSASEPAEGYQMFIGYTDQFINAPSFIPYAQLRIYSYTTGATTIDYQVNMSQVMGYCIYFYQ